MYTSYFSRDAPLNEIVDNLYLGSADESDQKEKLQKYQVTHILPVGIGLERHFPSEFQYFPKSIDVQDSEEEDLLQYFTDCAKFIEEGRKTGKVFVHCQAGISRSATIVIAYLMQKDQIPYEKARKIVQQKREIIYPNSGFVAQLRLFDKLKFRVDTEQEEYKQWKLKLVQEKQERAQKIAQMLSEMGVSGANESTF